MHYSLQMYGQDLTAERIRYTKEGMIFDVVVGEEVYSDISIPLLGEHQAKNCIKCGKCEAACPQKIAIRQDLEKAQKDLENKALDL